MTAQTTAEALAVIQGQPIDLILLDLGLPASGAKLLLQSLCEGQAARQICSSTSNSYHSLLPADVEGPVLAPAGSAAPLLSITTSSLLSWRYTVNWASGTASLTGPTTVSGVSAFSRACSGGTCIPQPGTTNKLDSLADRLNYRLSYRKFADGHESLVVNHAVSANGGTGDFICDIGGA